MSTPRIQPNEIQDGLMYRVGVPLPEFACATEMPDGSLLRWIRMGKGIEFDQVSTDWQAGRHVRWHYQFWPDSFPPRALDDHVKIGGEHFDLLDADYTLETQPDGTTKLRVALSYRVSTRFNWYARPVAELFVSNFEENALRFYARRAEAQAARSSHLY
jgi:hypothetical protein